MNPGKFFLGMAKAGFNFDKFANAQIAKHRGPAPEATLNEFRGLRESTSAPPGPKVSWLGEVVIHGADVRRPLGISHAYAAGAVRLVIDFYKGSNLLIGAKKAYRRAHAAGDRRRLAARAGRSGRGATAVVAAGHDRSGRRL
jgi:hypothetical protein